MNLVSNLHSLQQKQRNNSYQWRRQDLLRVGAKLEIRYGTLGTHGGLQGRVQQLLDDK